MKPHKHAELIKAWADGAVIEFNDGGEWRKVKCPAWDNEIEYRIKPEPKPDVVKYVVADSFDESYMYSAPQKDDGGIGPLYRQVKLTFDGETGKLKNAEVVK